MQISNFLAAAAMALVSVAASAQSLFVTKTDGTVHEYAVDKVKEISFGESSPNIGSATVTYVTNDGTDAKAAFTGIAGRVVMMGNGTSFERPGYKLAGWNTEADGSGFNIGHEDFMTISVNMTFYAQWQAIAVLTYKANNGTDGQVQQTHNAGTSVAVGDGVSFSRDEFALVGWATAADGSGTTYNSGDALTLNSDVTLYAIWASESAGSDNGHDWVDLGLTSGTRWATCNIGAADPTKIGDYFSWGETKAKETYSGSNYAYGTANGPDFSATKYEVGFSVLETADDAATANWGDKWAMPTPTQISELASECDWEYVAQPVAGFKAKSRKNSNYVFFPAAGACIGSGPANAMFVGTWCKYWSNMLTGPNMYSQAQCLDISGSGSSVAAKNDNNGMPRQHGLPIRPVRK